jgi:hypothetical protein
MALGYGVNDRVPAGAENFALHHRVQTGFGAHPASYSMGNKGLYLHFPNTPSWRGAQLKEAQGQLYI